MDKLAAIDIDINSDLLAIMLLYSLPGSFENFPCIIESRDNFPDVESLKVKILEENTARKQKSGDDSGTMIASWSKNSSKFKSRPNTQVREYKDSCKNKYDITCYRCNKKGHKTQNCYTKLDKIKHKVNVIDDVYYATLRSGEGGLQINDVKDIALIKDLNNNKVKMIAERVGNLYQ